MLADPTPRVTALASGRKYYWGITCAHGHGGLRYVRDRTCVKCRSIEARDRYRTRKQLSADRMCLVCARIFTASHYNKRTCSAECKIIAKRHHDRTVRRADHAERPCTTCGKVFTPKTKNNIYCSSFCSVTSPSHRARVLREFERRKRADAALKALTELGITI
jgi:hypothetical protein